MTYKSRRILVLTAVNLLMLGYVIFMFYKSEPEYVNNSYGKPIVGDYVNVYDNADFAHSFYCGMVVQTDSASFSLNVRTSMTDVQHNSGIYSIPYKGTVPYKIIGKGTFYHKVNAYLGFNIMFITICIIIVFFAVTFYTEINIIWQILNS
jgi:hypothetical protein